MEKIVINIKSKKIIGVQVGVPNVESRPNIKKIRSRNSREREKKQ